MKPILLVLALLIWMVGGNAVVAHSYRRQGMPGNTGLLLGGNHFRHLNTKERAVVIALYIVAFAIALPVIWS